MVEEVKKLDNQVSSKALFSVGDYVKIINRSIWNCSFNMDISQI